MNRRNQFDLENWGRRFEAGDRSDPLVDLAARLQEAAQNQAAQNQAAQKQEEPDFEAPSPAFREELRARLVEQYNERPGRARYAARRWVVWGLALLAVIALTIAGWLLLPGSAPQVSAAQVMEQASRRLAERLAAGELVYDRLILDWDQGGDWKRRGVVAELWRSADGSLLRYQMAERGDLLYFEQHDSQRLWRSSYVRPVEGLPVKFVYQAPYNPDVNYLGDKQLAAQLFFRDLANFWLYIDQVAGGGRSDCADLFCALSALGQGWECSGERCTLNLGPVIEQKDLWIQAQVSGQERLAGGREVYDIRLWLPETGERNYTILKFETSTYDLLEIEDFWDAKLHYRIRLDQRKSLARSDLPQGFFQSVPQGIEVRRWASDLPLGHKEDDLAWIISADPPSGASVAGVVNAHLEIGYRLTSIEAAAIEVGLGWVGHDTPYAIRDAKVPVQAGEGKLEMSFSVDSDQLGPGQWAVGVGFSDVLGIAPNTGWNGGGALKGIYLEWCVRCPSPSRAP